MKKACVPTCPCVCVSINRLHLAVRSTAEEDAEVIVEVTTNKVLRVWVDTNIVHPCTGSESPNKWWYIGSGLV